jgi:hypothetical protein
VTTRELVAQKLEVQQSAVTQRVSGHHRMSQLPAPLYCQRARYPSSRLIAAPTAIAVSSQIGAAKISGVPLARTIAWSGFERSSHPGGGDERL